MDNAKFYLGNLLDMTVAGSVQPRGGIWRSCSAAGGGQWEMIAWNSGLERFFREHATVLNAACAHVMGMDDVHNASITRLGVVTTPVALAMRQKSYRFGREVSAAVAAGYEIDARMEGAINPGSYHYWHTTGAVGVLCFAVTAGKLMGLDQKKLLHAIDSVGAQAAGLWQFLEGGTMSKTLHAANGTFCGLWSAHLAALGFIATGDILTGDQSLLGVMMPDNHPEALTWALSRESYALLTNFPKPYACYYHTHAADYYAQLLRGEYQLEPEHITRIVGHTCQVAINTVDNPESPTPCGYKFSGQCYTAAMLVYDHLGESASTPGATSDPRVRRLMDKIILAYDLELEASYQVDRNRWAYWLEVTLEDGQVLTRQVEYSHGDFSNPSTQAYEHEKFYTPADGVLGPDQITVLTERLPHLGGLNDVNRLFEEL